jgi:hypothetical protein
MSSTRRPWQDEDVSANGAGEANKVAGVAGRATRTEGVAENDGEEMTAPRRTPAACAE